MFVLACSLLLRIFLFPLVMFGLGVGMFSCLRFRYLLVPHPLFPLLQESLLSVPSCNSVLLNLQRRVVNLLKLAHVICGSLADTRRRTSSIASNLKPTSKQEYVVAFSLFFVIETQRAQNSLLFLVIIFGLSFSDFFILWSFRCLLPLDSFVIQVLTNFYSVFSHDQKEFRTAVTLMDEQPQAIWNMLKLGSHIDFFPILLRVKGRARLNDSGFESFLCLPFAIISH